MFSAVVASQWSAERHVPLHDATSQMLDLDPGSLDDATLHHLVARVQAERSRLSVAAAELLAEWDTRRIWQTDGSRSAANRLARETRASVRSTSEELRRARRIGHLPLTRTAVVEGRLSTDHLDLLAHVNTPKRRALFERDEAILVNQCVRLSFADGARAVRYWANQTDEELSDQHRADSRPGNDPKADDPNDDPNDGTGPATDDSTADFGTADASAPVDSRLYASRTIDDILILDGVFDAIGGTIIEQELNRLAEQIRLADQTAGSNRTPAQRRAAALIEMATRSAIAPADGRRPRPLFTVVVGEKTLDRLCELSNGIVITPDQLLAHLIEADIESVLFDGPSTIISVSSRRTFTGAIRRAIQVRDRRCQHPSQCDTPADDCDVDHIIPYSRGGPTSQWNAKIECRPHNRDHRLHDHGGTPLPERTVDHLDHLRAQLRWRMRNECYDTDDPPDPPD